MTNKLLVLWAPPRSLSTAFARVMDARGDFIVLHEPLCDLAAGHAFEYEFEGEVRRIKSPQVLFGHVRELLSKGNVFIKDTCEFAYPNAIGTEGYPVDAQHLFMLRDPEQVINSHYAMNPALTSEQVGYRHLHDLYCAVKASCTRSPIILDADELVLEPDRVISAFCRKVGIEEKPEALHWQAGHRRIWQRTRHWHEDAAQSTSIKPRHKTYAVRVDNDLRLQAFYEDNLVAYRKLLSCKLLDRSGLP